MITVAEECDDDILLTIEGVITDKSIMATDLTQAIKSKEQHLRELLLDSYVRGFIAGMNHALHDTKQFRN